MLFIVKLLLIYVLCFFDFDWLKFMPLMLPLMLSIAFFTVFERKVLGSIQRSSGPNFVGIFGLLQAMADGLKLLTKETMMPSSATKTMFMISPIFSFTLSLLGWVFVPLSSGIVIADVNLGLLFIFAMSSLNVYGIIMSGWSSNSKYAFLGALSSSAQMMSYEVSMGLLMMPPLMYAGTANLSGMVLAQANLWFIFPCLPSAILFFICILAETNSVPFDLPEAEPELVSGYNVEYSSMTFALFFLAEYSNIILMSTLFVILFLGGWLPIFTFGIFTAVPGWLWMSIKVLFMMFSFIWVSGTLPRYRFDQLMALGWKVMLPLSLFFLLDSIMMYLFYIYILT